MQNYPIRSLKLLIALLGVPILASTARADQPASTTASAQPESDEYKLLIRQAVSEFDAGAFAEARSLFERAHALLPSARTLRGLGMTSYELHHYVRALAELEAALADSRNPLTEDQRREVSGIIVRARGYVVTVQVELVPADALLSVDGQPVAERELHLDLGDHTLSAQAPGRRDAELKLNVEGGSTRSVTLELPPLEGELAAAENDSVATAQPSRKGAGVWPFVVVGVSGALAVTGGVLVGLALSAKSSVENAKPDSNWSSVKSDYSKVSPLSTAGFVLLGAGLAGVTGGLLWKYVFQHDEPDSVAITATGTGVSIAGKF